MGTAAPPLSGPGTSVAQRVLTGVVAVPLLFGVAYVGGPVYGVVIAGAAVLAAWEARLMLRAGGHAPQSVLLVVLSAALPLDAWFFQSGDARTFGAPHGMLILGVATIASLSASLLRPRLQDVLVDWSLSLGLALYLGGLMQFFAPLRQHPDGALWVSLLLALSWICDSTAYFVGRAFGRLRLAPTISPKKSVEGAVAGLLGSVLAGALVGLAMGRPVPLLAGYGLAIAVATIVGDLVESLVKRQTGVKDSGVLVPGHGGILDRMDSLLFCAPVAAFYLLAFA